MAQVSAESSSIAVYNPGNGSVVVNMTTQLGQLPSVLTPLLLQIVQHHKPRFDPKVLLEKSPEIEEKISFNQLKYFSDEIRNNSEFMAIVEEALIIVDDEEPGAKSTIQWTINKIYKDVKRKILMENKVNMSDKNQIQTVINNNSDIIFNEVSERLFCLDSSGIPCVRENLLAAKELLTCYGFIGCMILENPEK